MITKTPLPKFDMRLGRIIEHDSRSLEFSFDTTGLSVVDVTHTRYVPIFNQGQVGSCTGNAGIGAISTAPFLNQDNTTYSRDEAGALKLYSAAEKIDGGDGYPPEDKGSSGLSIAKALTNANLISGYQHVFTLNDALKAGSLYAFITGITWYSDMFTPDTDGRVHPTGTVAGGHEIELSQIDVENGRVWFNNSWGTSWGIKGRFYLTWQDFEKLLAEQGDVIILIPPHTTPPNPAPTQSVVLARGTDDGVETTGVLRVGDPEIQFECVTLELTYKDNKPMVSAIPPGTYHCMLAFQSDLNEYHYELQNVTGRTGIFIHEGNYYTNSNGCIILGATLADINADGQLDTTNSKVTVAQFEALMDKKPFMLEIA